MTEKKEKKNKKIDILYIPDWCKNWFCLRKENHKGACSDYVG